MSIYRRPRILSEDNVHAPVVRDAQPVVVEHTPPNPASSYAPLRKANPVNKLLAISVKWIDSLPDDVRPRLLIQHYPRIVNLLALEWNDPVDCRKMLDELILDKRGSRRGFPPEVQRELRLLNDHYYLDLVRRR